MRKNDILKSSLIALLIILSFFFANNYITNVKADSGFDSSWDSGGWDSGGSSWDSGGWDSGGSSWDSSDWDSGGSSGGSSSGGGMVFILFVVIIIVIILASRKSNNTTVAVPSPMALDHSKELSFDQIKAILPDYERNNFVYSRFNDFVLIQQSWMNFDMDKLREKLTDELFNQYSMQLDTLKVKNQVNVMHDFKFCDAMITNISKVNNQVTVTMELTTEFFDYLTQNGQVVRGNSSRKMFMHYELTFVCNLSGLSNTCPNCGAKLPTSASKKCEYCGSVVTEVSSSWVMSKKEAMY